MKLPPVDQLNKYGVPIYRTNPSVPSASELSRQKRKPVAEAKGFVVNGSGELLSGGFAVAYEIEEVDDERFVKLFLDGIKQTTGLSRSGLMVFELVYTELRNNPKQDTVHLSVRETTMTKQTFYRGLRELLDGKFLFRSPYDGMFFVNIRYVFNGDRLAFVKAYHRKGRRSAAHPDQTALPFIEAEVDA